MNTRANTLQFLLNHALDKLSQATKAMAQAQQLLWQTQEKGQMLRAYRQDYTDQLAQQLQLGLKQEKHRNYQQFLNKLEQAIAGQDTITVDAQYQFQERQKAWQAAQQKKMAYEVLIKQAGQALRVAESRKEQKMIDEYAMRSKRSGAN